ncbi:MAG: succinate dehydrogenase, hydrophobic membrane anchor protein [Planctomycetota bacterium]
MSFVRWFLQRITGLLLVACLGAHTIILHFTGHSPVDINVVHDRLKDSFWLVFYIVFLASTLFHGLNGLYEVIEDYKPSRSVQSLLGIACWCAGFVALVWGVYVLMAWRNITL